MVFSLGLLKVFPSLVALFFQVLLIVAVIDLDCQLYKFRQVVWSV
jgi:hypothetical protein